MPKYSKIVGTGAYLPEKIMTNFDLEKIVDTSDEWITERSGIKQRHIASVHETNTMMSATAGQAAIEAAGLKPEDIDLVIIGTVTPDRPFPSTAALVQHKLGIPACIAFDISVACAGFIYGLSIADSWIRTGQIKTALVIGTEIMSHVLDWTDRSTCVLFGDGSGAVVLTGADEPGIFGCDISADGQYGDMITMPSPLLACLDKGPKPVATMVGREVYKVAVNTMRDLVVNTLERFGFEKSDLTWLIPHQANMRIIAAIAKRLEMPMEQIILTIAEHGNTSAASVPLAMDAGFRDGRLRSGDLVLIEAFGAGLAWGSALIRL